MHIVRHPAFRWVITVILLVLMGFQLWSRSDQFQVFITPDTSHSLGGHKRELLPLFLAAFEFVEVDVDAVDSAVDEATKDLASRLEKTGDRDRGGNDCDSRRIGLVCGSSIGSLQAKENDAEDGRQDDR